LRDPDQSVSPDLRGWMQKRAPDVVLVLEFLRRNPTEFGAILTIARLERAVELDYAADNIGAARLEIEREAVADYMASARLLACATCFVPAVYFGDGRKVDWPSLAAHECEAPSPPEPARGRTLDRVGRR
jgi:hypothetical protein